MAVSKTHKAGLERQLKVHVRDVAGLRAQLKSLDAELARREKGKWSDPNPKPGRGILALRDQRVLIELEIERHLAILALAQDERFVRTLDELAEDPELIDKAARDPKAFARARGLRLPNTVELEVDEVEGHPRVRVVNYDREVPFTMTWDRRGFTFAE